MSKKLDFAGFNILFILALLILLGVLVSGAIGAAVVGCIILLL